MPDVRKLVISALSPARAVGRGVAGAISSLRRQAPGARMVGEFVVKAGTDEVAKRLKGRVK